MQHLTPYAPDGIQGHFLTLNPNHMTLQDKENLLLALQLKDEEIARQIAKRKLAEQTRNWTIIIVVVINILIWVI